MELELLFFTVFIGDRVSSLDFCNTFCFRVKLDVSPVEHGNNDDDVNEGKQNLGSLVLNLINC